MFGIKPVYFVNLVLCLFWAGLMTVLKIVTREGVLTSTGIYVFQRVVTTAIVFFLIVGLPRHERRVRPRHWVPLIVIAVFMTLMMYLYLWAFWFFDVSVANSTILARTDLIFAMLLGWFLMNDRVSPLELVAVAGMLLGVVAITGWRPEDMRLEQLGGHLLVVLATFLVTVNAFIIRLALKDLNNHMIAFMNNLLSCAMLVAIYAAMQIAGGHGARDVAAYIDRPDLFALTVLLGIVAAGVFVLYYYCLHRLPVWQVRTFLLFTPLFAVPMAWLAPTLREPLSLRQAVGMIAVIGFGFWLMWQSRPKAAPAPRGADTD